MGTLHYKAFFEFLANMKAIVHLHGCRQVSNSGCLHEMLLRVLHVHKNKTDALQLNREANNICNVTAQMPIFGYHTL